MQIDEVARCSEISLAEAGHVTGRRSEGDLYPVVVHRSNR